MDWCRRDGEDWLLHLHVQPGAKTTAVAGRHGDSLKIRIAAPPVEGKANEALIAFIAAQLGVPKRAVCVDKGGTSREKTLRVSAIAIDPGRLLAEK